MISQPPHHPFSPSFLSSSANPPPSHSLTPSLASLHCSTNRRHPLPTIFHPHTQKSLHPYLKPNYSTLRSTVRKKEKNNKARVGRVTMANLPGGEDAGDQIYSGLDLVYLEIPISVSALSSSDPLIPLRCHRHKMDSIFAFRKLLSVSLHPLLAKICVCTRMESIWSEVVVVVS